MPKILWDQAGERLYETGVDRGVLYIPNNVGVYDTGFAWNGLTTVTESPSGAEATPQYADNIKYLNLVSVEDFGGTIEAYTYPKKFEQCDGTSSPSVGISVGQQRRKSFGLGYRTLVGNDIAGTDFGYKVHLVYGALATPSEKARATVNDSPEALSFSWGFSTTSVDIPGLDVDGIAFKPSSKLTIDSTTVPNAKLLLLEDILYGTAALTPRLPLPAEVFALFANSQTIVTVIAPTATAAGVITIPTVTGVVYRRADTNAVVAGGSTVTISAINASLTIKAAPASGLFTFSAASDDDFVFTRTT